MVRRERKASNTAAQLQSNEADDSLAVGIVLHATWGNGFFFQTSCPQEAERRGCMSPRDRDEYEVARMVK